jgi:SAM-dependent methyltransferase
MARCGWFLFLLSAALIGACHSPAGPAPAPPPPAPAQPPVASAPATQAAPRDINAEFKKDLLVQEWVEKFEGESREIYRYRRQIADRCGLRAGDDVADIGAGTGLFVALFAERVGTEGTVYAVDIAPQFLQHIAERAEKQGLRNVTTVLCPEDSVNLPADSIDVAFVCDTYHHFQYPEQSTRSIHRALRRGGRLVIVDFIRIPGVSREWVLNHVRAGQDTFTREITACSFEQLMDVPTLPELRENYLVVFRKR